MDGQALQSFAWHRGIGKYSLELLQAVLAARPPGRLEVHLLLSTKLPDEGRSEHLRTLLPEARLVFLDLQPGEVGTGPAADHNRRTIDAWLAAQLPDATDPAFLSLCLMVDNVVSAFPTDRRFRRMVVVYDLIPLMFHDVYLRSDFARRLYLSRVAELLAADDYLAISRTVANDLSLYLGVRGDRVTVLEGGPVAHLAPAATAASTPAAPYVLMPTGNDARKNNRRAVMGFARFNARHDDRYRLVITSTFRAREIEDLSRLCPQVVFTGNVSGEELGALYRQSTALLFPPEYEGLGLPILEAVEVGKPIACSAIAVFREMSTTAFETFDPHSVVEIADAVERAVLRTGVDEAAYAEIAARYTWPRTAEQFLAVLERPGSRRDGPMSRVAVVGPEPAGAGTVGALLQLTHAELARVATVDYVLSGTPAQTSPPPRVDLLSYVTSTRRVAPGLAFDPTDYDQVVFHLDDDPDCAGTLLLALAHTGTVVLHAPVLAQAWTALADLGLADPGRVQVERLLDGQAGGRGALLASVLARAGRVLCDDVSVAEAAHRVASVVAPRLEIRLVPRPVTTPRFPDTRPLRRVVARELADLPTDGTDVQRDEARAGLWCAVTHLPGTDPEVLAVRRLGVVPVRTEDAAAALVAKPVAYERRSAAVTAEVAAEHDPGAFLAALGLSPG